MKYISIDGDNVGQKITSAYLTNDLAALSSVSDLVKEKTRLISEFLKAKGFVVIFCAADGVAGYCEDDKVDEDLIYGAIQTIANDEMTFSAGVGQNLRESYIALLSAKSSGKACLRIFKDLIKNA